MGKEETRYVDKPREEAFKYVTEQGRHKLKVDKWLDAGRPGASAISEPVQDTVVRACGFCFSKFCTENLQL